MINNIINNSVKTLHSINTLIVFATSFTIIVFLVICTYPICCIYLVSWLLFMVNVGVSCRLSYSCRFLSLWRPFLSRGTLWLHAPIWVWVVVSLSSPNSDHSCLWAVYTGYDDDDNDEFDCRILTYPYHFCF